MSQGELPGPNKALCTGIGLESFHFHISKAVAWLEELEGFQIDFEAFFKLQNCNHLTAVCGLAADQGNAFSHLQEIDWPAPNFKTLA